MLRYVRETFRDGGANHIEIACLSTDTKPTEKVATGSIAFEVDTGKFYAYDEDSTTWLEVAGE